MTQIPDNSFVLIKVKRPDPALFDYAVAITSRRRGRLMCRRLWEQHIDRPGVHCNEMYEGSASDWFGKSYFTTHLIYPDHPDYDKWWGWYVACQMGVKGDPPI